MLNFLLWTGGTHASTQTKLRMLKRELFIARQQVTLHEIGGSTRWDSKECSAWFGGIAADALLLAVTQGLEAIENHLIKNLKARGLDVGEDIMERIALSAAMDILLSHHGNHQPLAVDESDLTYHKLRSHCVSGCKFAFRDSYAGFAAAMLGVQIEAVLDWEFALSQPAERGAW